MNTAIKDAVIHADGLTKRFGDLTAVDRLCLTVGKGEIFGLVGPDGAGKTTTLRLLSGIMDPTGGRSHLAGFEVAQQPELVKDHMAYMSQRFGLYPDLTVEENIKFYADLYGVPRKGRKQRIDELLDFSALGPFKKRLADKLSGGMKQKLQLVCALVHTPDVLLLDEPTNGVDPVSRRDFWRILYRLLKDGVTILVTTAYLDEAERCNRVGLLDHGRLLAEGSPEHIKTLMTGRMLSLRCSNTQKARKILRAGLAEADSVNMFGDTLHLICRDPEKTGAAVPSLLEKEGVAVAELQEVSPSLEDVFVSVLGKKDTDRDRQSTAPVTQEKLSGTVCQMEEVAVEVSGLSRSFGDFKAVDGLNFSVSRGEIFGFLGPNGAGKSTTIRMLCGLLPPSAGAGKVAGCDLVGEPERIKKSIGYMSQKFSLYEDLTVEENINFYGGIYGLGGSRLELRKDWAVDMSGLADRRQSLTRFLSGGWKQRLALACAILHEPPIIFLDEPTSGVDPLSRRRFWDLIYAMAEGGVTVFVTTHYMEEAEYCDRIAMIYHGRMIALGTPRELKTETMHEKVLDVRCVRPQDAIDAVATLPGVRDAALFGAGLHLVVDNVKEAMGVVEKEMARIGEPVLHMESILPSMEDVFVSLIEGEDRRNGA